MRLKKITFFILIMMSCSVYSQQSLKGYSDISETLKTERIKPFSLSTTAGYITIPQPNLGNNVWCSANLGWNRKNWNITVWAGTNYWIEGRQPDLRLGVSTTYTWFKW